MALTVFCGRPASVPHARHTKASCDASEFVSAAATCAKHIMKPATNPKITWRREFQPQAQDKFRCDFVRDKAGPCSQERAAFNNFSVTFVRATGQLENAQALLNGPQLCRRPAAERCPVIPPVDAPSAPVAFQRCCGWSSTKLRSNSQRIRATEPYRISAQPMELSHIPARSRHLPACTDRSHWRPGRASHPG